MAETGIETILQEHHGAGRDSLIPILQEIQEDQGYLQPKP